MFKYTSMNSPAICFGDASPSWLLLFLTVSLFWFVLDMLHSDVFHKTVVSNDVKSNEVNEDVKLDEVNDDVKSSARSVDVELYVGQQFKNEQLFTVREDILEWVRMKIRKLGFDIVIGKSDNGSNKRQ